MSGFPSSSRRRARPLPIRAASGVAASVAGMLVWLVLAGPALAIEPVDLGDAAAYSTLSGFSITSTGATAMSENLGVSPSATLAGTPIVLGETHLGDAQSAAAITSLGRAYGDAVLRPSAVLATADFIGQTFTTGAYGTPGAMGFSGGTLTLDAQGDPDAVFIFQIGGALSVAASTTVALVDKAQACNVFWTVGSAMTVGATARFTGTVMADDAITVGASSRVDGRLLANHGAVTLASNAIRTDRCAAPPVVVTGPAGPAGPAGADGARGATGADGTNGTNGTNGIDGTDGNDGSAGAPGPLGLTGATGLTGAVGPMGLVGATGLGGIAGLPGSIGATGLMGPPGPAGAVASAPTGATTKLCVSTTAGRRKVRRGGLVGWTIVVTNCGQAVAAGVQVTDRLRRGASFASLGGGTLADGQLGWRTDSLAPGARATYRITTRLNRRGGTYVNRVVADGANTAPSVGQGSTSVR